MVVSRRSGNEISTLLATETIENIEATTCATISTYPRSLSRGGVRVAQSSQQLFERWRVNRSAATSVLAVWPNFQHVRLDLEFSVGDPLALCIAVGFWSSGGSGTATRSCTLDRCQWPYYTIRLLPRPLPCKVLGFPLNLIHLLVPPLPSPSPSRRTCHLKSHCNHASSIPSRSFISTMVDGWITRNAFLIVLLNFLGTLYCVFYGYN